MIDVLFLFFEFALESWMKMNEIWPNLNIFENTYSSIKKYADKLSLMGHSRASFSLFSSFQYSKLMFNVNLNHGPQVSEATTRPTEPRPRGQAVYVRVKIQKYLSWLKF